MHLTGILLLHVSCLKQKEMTVRSLILRQVCIPVQQIKKSLGIELMPQQVSSYGTQEQSEFNLMLSI